MQFPIPLGQWPSVPIPSTRNMASDLNINPMRMGAKGNGSDLDVQIIQRAFDEASAFQAAYGGAAIVEINRMYRVAKQGTFNVNGPVNYCLRVPSNITIVGYGKTTGFICPEDGATILLGAGDSDLAHLQSVTIDNIAIIGTDTTMNDHGRGIYLFRADECTISRCDISGSNQGIQLDRPSGDVNYNSGNLINANRIHDTFGSASGWGTAMFVAFSEGTRFLGNRLFRIAEHGIYVCVGTRDLIVAGNDIRPIGATNQNACVHIFTSEANPDLQGIVVSGNMCIGGKWGILASTQFQKILEVSVSSNRVKGQNGALSGTVGNAAIQFSNVQEGIIQGNNVSDTVTCTGIEVDNGRNVQILGNTSVRNGLCGITLFNTQDSVVDGNTAADNDLSNSTNYGIRITSGSTGNRVTNNVCSDYQAVHTQKFGIQADADCGHLLVSGNKLSGNVTAPLSIAATTNVSVKDNDGWDVPAQNIAVGASPWTFTNGVQPGTLYIKGGTVTNIARGAIVFGTATNRSIHLGPGQSVTITYSVAPTASFDTEVLP